MSDGEKSLEQQGREVGTVIGFVIGWILVGVVAMGVVFFVAGVVLRIGRWMLGAFG